MKHNLASLTNWTSRTAHEDGEFTPVGPDTHGDLGRLLVEAIWNHQGSSTGTKTYIWRNDIGTMIEEWRVWTGHHNDQLAVFVFSPDGKTTVLAAIN